MSWLYILTVCIRVSSSFLFFAKNLMSFIYIWWLIFSCNLLSLYTAVHFLSIWLSVIMAIKNSKDDSAYPRKISLCIFVSGKLLPPAVNSTLLVFMVFSMKSMTICTFWDSLFSSFVEPLLLLFTFHIYFHFLAIFRWVFSKNLRWGKKEFICI